MSKLYEKFTSQLDSNRKNRKLGSPVFKNTVAGLIVIACMLADFAAVFGPIDSIYTQNLAVTGILSLVAVLGLDLSPSLIAGMTSRGEFKPLKFLVLSLAFGLSLYSVIILRRANIYNDFANTGALGLESIKESDLVISPLQKAGSFFVSVMPIVTSILSFCVNYDNDYFDNQIGHLSSQENTMEDYMDKFNINSEIHEGLEEKLEDKYQESISDIMSYDLTLLDYCKSRLALACNDPDTTTRLLEYFDKEINQIKSQEEALDYKAFT